jgi:phenylpropionate dioxygenase-like ring-hydroxylating dioxygenase large terminal subunit
MAVELLSHRSAAPQPSGRANTMTSVSHDLADATARAVLAKKRPAGYSLPREFYVEPSVYREDLQRVFLNHPLVAGHLASIPRPGDYFLYDIGFESFIVVRSHEDSVRVLVNVCPHRGSRVCIEEYGHCRHFACPLCGWVFDLDGTLYEAANMPPEFDRSRHGLTRANVAVVEGVILFWLHDGADISRLASDAKSFLRQYALADTRIAYHRRYLCPANWKLVVESFLELHYSGANFPEMRQVMAKAEAAASRDADKQRRYAEFVAAWQNQSPAPTNLASHSAGDGPIDYSCTREPIRANYETQSQDGKLLAPLLGNQTASDGGVTVVRILSTWIIACADYVVIVRFTPLDAHVTEMDVTWLVRDSAVEAVDYDAQQLAWLWRANVERTLKLATDHQLGVNSRHYRPGPFAPNEQPLDDWATWYLSRFV